MLVIEKTPAGKKFSGIKTQADAVRHFFQQMDVEMLDMILDDGITCQDRTKQKFLGLVTLAFQLMQKDGDTELMISEGHCSGCTKNHKGLRFTGNYSGKYLNMLFLEKDGKITDIYECYQFEAKGGKPKNYQVVLKYLDLDCDSPF